MSSWLRVFILAGFILGHSSFIRAAAPEYAQGGDRWCQDPKNFPEYKKMVTELNNQLSCQLLEPSDCMMITGTLGMGTLYGGAKGVQAHKESHGVKPAINCQVRVPSPQERGYLEAFWNILDSAVIVEMIFPRSYARGGCVMSSASRWRMERMASTGANFHQAEFTKANTELKAVEGELRAVQQTVDDELKAMKAAIGDTSANNLGLGKVEQHLATDRKALADGWNGFLKDRATRLRSEYLAALNSGDESGARIAAMEIREFIGTNFSDEVQRGIKATTSAQEIANYKKGPQLVTQQLDALIGQAPESFGQSADDLWKLCQSRKVECSPKLKAALDKIPSLNNRMSQVSRTTNIARAKHRLLSGVASTVSKRGVTINGAQARELMLTMTENLDHRFMIFNDFKILAGEMGYTTETLGRLSTNTSGARHAALKGGQTVEQVFARRGIARGLVGIGGRALAGLGLMAAGTATVLASTPVMAATLVLAPDNMTGVCNGSVPTSMYATTDEFCRTQVAYNERTLAFVTMPIEEQVAEMDQFPEMCSVVRKSYDGVKPTRWEAKCHSGSDGKSGTFTAKLRGQDQVFQEGRWGTDGELKFFRMYSPSGTGGVTRGGFGMNLDKGQPAEVRFRDDMGVTGSDDFHKARLEALEFENPRLYKSYNPAAYKDESGQYDWESLSGIEMDVATATSQFAANRMSLTEMAACCQGAHSSDRCSQYGITVPQSQSRPGGGATSGTH